MTRIKLSMILGICIPLQGGFSEDTVIKTPPSYTTVKDACNNTIVSSINIAPMMHIETKVIYTQQRESASSYIIALPDCSINCSKHQKFYDPMLQAWVSAKDITSKSHFLDYYGNIIPCIASSKLYKPIVLYDITLTYPHTYFVSNAHILTHNAIPIIVGISWAFGEGCCLTGIGCGLGFLGLGLWQKFGKNKKTNLSLIEQQPNNYNLAGGPPDPENKDKVKNMNEFFNTRFGKKIKTSIEKTNKQYDGQTIYRVRKKIPEYGLRKGDQIYLDGLHKNHLEVFTKHNRFKTILNLDGTKNIIKAINAIGRKI